MNGKQTPMMRTNATVAGLNKVAGFDPVKLLQGSINSRAADEAEKLRLKLRYKKLWFRLACPQGRIRLSALRITEQLAIIEARVYLHKEDPEPVANFTAERRAQDSPLYIQAAQYEAQDNALTDAGFGIQLCDVCQAVGEEAYTPRRPEAPLATDDVVSPPSKADSIPTDPLQQPSEEGGLAGQEEPAGAEQETGAGQELVTEDAIPDGESEQRQPLPDTPVEEVAPLLPGETTGPVETHAADEAAPVSDFDAEADADVHEESPVDEADPAPVLEGGYSPNMTMEEIAARMTLDEALSITADVGMCRGQTLAHIADKRPASLRWYIMGCKEASNVLKAGAKLVLDSLTMPQSA